MNIQNPGIVKTVLFKHVQGYLAIFNDTNANSATFTGTQLGEGRREASAALFKNISGKKP